MPEQSKARQGISQHWRSAVKCPYCPWPEHLCLGNSGVFQKLTTTSTTVAPRHQLRVPGQTAACSSNPTSVLKPACLQDGRSSTFKLKGTIHNTSTNPFELPERTHAKRLSFNHHHLKDNLVACVRLSCTKQLQLSSCMSCTPGHFLKKAPVLAMSATLSRFASKSILHVMNVLPCLLGKVL